MRGQKECAAGEWPHPAGAAKATRAHEGRGKIRAGDRAGCLYTGRWSFGAGTAWALALLPLALEALTPGFAHAAPATGAALVTPATATPVGVHKGDVLLASVEGSINAGSYDYLISAIDEAERTTAGALLIELDTPGGLLEATRNLVKRMLGAKVPIIVYVSPAGARAGSAGVFITMAAHVAAMAPTTNIGAATPVTMGGGEGDGKESDNAKKLARKIENDTIAWARGIAEQRGRNPDWAEKAITEAASITAQDALKQTVIDLIAPSRSELLRLASGRTVQLGQEGYTLDVTQAAIRPYAWSLKQRFTNGFSDPNIMYILFSIGMIGLMLEFYNPGIMIGGVAGGICLLLALIGMQAVPINYGALALLAVGFGLAIAEMFVTSHGVLGVGGAVAFLIGSVLLVDSHDPEVLYEPGFGVSWQTIVPAITAWSAITFGVVTALVRTRGRPIVTGMEAMVGLVGTVLDDIVPGGPEAQIFVRGENWRARCDEAVARGEKVEVVALDGLTAVVRRAGRARPPST